MRKNHIKITKIPRVKVTFYILQSNYDYLLQHIAIVERDQGLKITLSRAINALLTQCQYGKVITNEEQYRSRRRGLATLYKKGLTRDEQIQAKRDIETGRATYRALFGCDPPVSLSTPTAVPKPAEGLRPRAPSCKLNTMTEAEMLAAEEALIAEEESKNDKG